MNEEPGTSGSEGGAVNEGAAERPRSVNLAVVAGGMILIGLVAFALYRRNNPPAPRGVAGTEASGAEASSATPPEGGASITATVPVRLSPEASIIVERYRCVCSCNDPLSECTCTLTPGSHDMKSYVQELVGQKKTGREIDEAMVARYGAAVLLSNSPTATPAQP